MAKRIKGMSMCNPVMLDRDYLIKTAQYAIDNGYTHFEIIGPTHDPVRGNLDGMMYYRKYSQFNKDKDSEYVDFCLKLVNEVTDMLKPHGIKVYYWHHELEIPLRFDEEFPEIHNSDGDVEVSHPLIKDFLVNKVEDFFAQYPGMDGFILTLHETRIPLLKLKNQKLGKIERVKYVTETLYEACKRLGKELIVRPFASMLSDYDDLMSAYEQISSELVVCDKWTQFDWSLTMPNNEFFDKIKNNPLMVETDIFGEYFGKGFLPIMLKDHIVNKYAYCEGYDPKGYVSRIDRGGFIPFGTPNEVNLEIMSACQDGRNVDEAIDAFFTRAYGDCGPAVRELMEGTEDIQIKMFYVNKVEFNTLSLFPSLSYIVTAQKIEMFRDKPEFDQTAWYIPKDYVRPPLEELTRTKREAVLESEAKLRDLSKLKGKLSDEQYHGLYTRFANMNIAARLWEQLTFACIGLARFYEKGDEDGIAQYKAATEQLAIIDSEAFDQLGEEYYCYALGKTAPGKDTRSNVPYFIKQVTDTMEKETREIRLLAEKGLLDFVVCGGINERHGLRKEINFSSSHVKDDGVCRLAGSSRGKKWSVVKAHGWFSYNLKVRPLEENTIIVTAKGWDSDMVDLSVTVGEEKTVFSQRSEEKVALTVKYRETLGNDTVTVRIDRTTENMPIVYTIEVL